MTDNSSPTDIFRPIVQRCPLPEITALSRPIELWQKKNERWKGRHKQGYDS